MKISSIVSKICLVVSLTTAVATLADESLMQELKQAVKAEGKDYLDQRSRLVTMYKAREDEFRAIKAKEPDWQIGLLISIVEERATKGALVESKVLNVRVGDIYARSYPEIIFSIVQALTNNAQATPMVLVEKVWKNNEYSNFTSDGSEVYPGVMLTLGDLKPPYAREVLESVVTNRNYYDNRPEYVHFKDESDRGDNRKRGRLQMARGYAAKALGLIGDERSVPALIAALKAVLDEKQDLNASVVDTAIRSCATKDTITVLEKAKEAGSKPYFIEGIDRIIKAVQQKK